MPTKSVSYKILKAHPTLDSFSKARCKGDKIFKGIAQRFSRYRSDMNKKIKEYNLNKKEDEKKPLITKEEAYLHIRNLELARSEHGDDSSSSSSEHGDDSSSSPPHSPLPLPLQPRGRHRSTSRDNDPSSSSSPPPASHSPPVHSSLQEFQVELHRLSTQHEEMNKRLSTQQEEMNKRLEQQNLRLEQRITPLEGWMEEQKQGDDTPLPSIEPSPLPSIESSPVVQELKEELRRLSAQLGEKVENLEKKERERRALEELKEKERQEEIDLKYEKFNKKDRSTDWWGGDGYTYYIDRRLVQNTPRKFQYLMLDMNMENEMWIDAERSHERYMFDYIVNNRGIWHEVNQFKEGSKKKIFRECFCMVDSTGYHLFDIYKQVHNMICTSRCKKKAHFTDEEVDIVSLYLEEQQRKRGSVKKMKSCV
jgi:hypothetical protein